MIETQTFLAGGWAWISLAIVTAGLAEMKHRGRWTWFLLALIFGPIATALVVIWRRPDSPFGR
ncbi:hypothetical protein [Salinibacterium sp. M195]|uniref:hypothetical protein n=1 Tax=Salinibacterium sp. M195 TaxID=2583374 RepID=UPI001C63623F|nr:hypothetical protein [Salinibacterium sp. M195]QYH34963.1 hypothetical protein FFT87_02800 [Salinibacterium sp. M195]